MIEPSIAERARRIVVEHLNPDDCPGTVTDDAAFHRDLAADSFDAVELAMAFEQEFGVVLPDIDLVQDYTVREVIDIITQLLAKAA